MSISRAVTLLASAARTATTVNSADQVSREFGAEEYRGVHLVLDITVVTGTDPTLDIKLQRKDAESGEYVDLPGAAFAQQTGTGRVDLTVYPGIAETADRSVSDVLSETWRSVSTIGGTSTPTFTYSLAGSYIP